MKNELAPSSVRVALVDSSPEDYANILAAAGMPGVSLHFLVSGNDALRFSRRWQSGLWVINTRLCDMSGFDLAEMLRSVRPGLLTFMIGDEYNLDEELQTLTLGLPKYLCKPLEPSWVLPQYGESCIPMPAFREAKPRLRVFSATGEHREEQLSGDSAGRDFATNPNDSILPFHRHGRPAA